MQGFVTYCSEKLEEVDFSWCRGIPNSAIGLLVDSCPNLKKVTIFGCSQVSSSLEGAKHAVLINIFFLQCLFNRLVQSYEDARKLATCPGLL